MRFRVKALTVVISLPETGSWLRTSILVYLSEHLPHSRRWILQLALPIAKPLILCSVCWTPPALFVNYMHSFLQVTVWSETSPLCHRRRGFFGSDWWSQHCPSRRGSSSVPHLRGRTCLAVSLGATATRHADPGPLLLFFLSFFPPPVTRTLLSMIILKIMDHLICIEEIMASVKSTHVNVSRSQNFKNIWFQLFCLSTIPRGPI